MIRQLITGVLAWLFACGACFAQPIADTASSTQGQSSVKLAAVVMALPPGTPWLTLRQGSIICIQNPITRTWSGERARQDPSAYTPSFNTEMRSAGYKAADGADNLFDREAGAADYMAAAVISDVHIDGCVSDGTFLSDRGSIRGDSSMRIDWQIYSPIKKQVVARISTSGAAKLSSSVQGGYQRLLVEAFADNVRALGANADFRTAMSAAKPLADGFVLPGQQSKIALAGSLKAPSRRIDDAVGSVVMLANGMGSGSGILVSDDGYVLTNAHVVGDEKTIRVRWSDRIETLGEVVRVAKDRDVALVKTNPRERAPLAIKHGAVSPGQRVYAIGTPLDKTFQSSVSSGVVSGNRIINGLRFIQSDVSISSGSSGGALLDENGVVIGITVSHYLNDGLPAGLNMFIPIGDAMDFLSLEQR